MDKYIIDISEDFEQGEFPPWPICENEILEYEEAYLVTSHGSKAAVHATCVNMVKGTIKRNDNI